MLLCWQTSDFHERTRGSRMIEGMEEMREKDKVSEKEDGEATGRAGRQRECEGARQARSGKKAAEWR